MKIIVQYSGGKDSQASLLWAVEKYGAKNITAQFSDTKWESPITYKHIKETLDDLGVELIELTNKKFGGMEGMVKYKGRFPSPKARFCTEELKVKPFIDWLLDECHESVLLIQGIRKAESSRRSKMSESCRLFKYYLQPYGHDIKKISEKYPKGKPKFHNYRKKDVLKWIEKYDDSILRPMFHESGQYVIDYIKLKGQKPNPLYKMAMNRVGCFPCIMITVPEFGQYAERFPDRIEELVKIEEEQGTSFFTPGKIPTHACSNNHFPTIRDMVKYTKGKNATLDMFNEEPTSCMSYYNQCE